MFCVYVGPVHKSSFVPSKWELLKVKEILRGMKDGSYVSIAERRKQQQQQNDMPFLIWQDTEDEVLAESKRWVVCLTCMACIDMGVWVGGMVYMLCGILEVYDEDIF
ncbi:hypothetical protein EON64_14230 [archaeon]|nr:MAG: hypothetical protein EON64_14230 [archaeon]